MLPCAQALYSYAAKMMLWAMSAFLASSLHAQDAQTAVHSAQISAETGQPIFYIFSGSDWCAPCKRLEKRVWSDTAWQAFAGRRLQVVHVDFPRSNPLPKGAQARNDALARRFNPALRFPYLVLTAADGAWLEPVSTRASSAAAMIAHLESVLRTHHAPD